ncbi:MAG: nucleotidyltransferase domain-containing protein [Acidimicrobiales bacterium]
MITIGIEPGARTASDGLRQRLVRATQVRPSAILAARRGQVIEILQRHGITGARLAGSAASGDDGPESDLDLVSHLPEHFGGGL